MDAATGPVHEINPIYHTQHGWRTKNGPLTGAPGEGFLLEVPERDEGRPWLRYDPEANTAIGYLRPPILMEANRHGREERNKLLPALHKLALDINGQPSSFPTTGVAPMPAPGWRAAASRPALRVTVPSSEGSPVASNESDDYQIQIFTVANCPPRIPRHGTQPIEISAVLASRPVEAFMPVVETQSESEPPTLAIPPCLPQREIERLRAERWEIYSSS
ncbi:MAG: hypothetical protein MMC23_000016 [Stictis urceolatum]|nr:hypothetical protein [Stictis urceolata]